MAWNRHHSNSENLAIDAEDARRAGNLQCAQALYRQAAAEEAEAFANLPVDKQKTRGVTAVSAVALSYKAREYGEAERLAYRYLAEEQLPPFALAQLRDLLRSILTAQGAERTRIRIVPVKDGEST